MAIYFRLFHGRPTPETVLDDWGLNGPVFGIFDWIHTVYINHFVFGCDDDESLNVELTIVEDLIYYDGVYYGDMDVHTEHTISDEMLKQVVLYDHEKGLRPAMTKATLLVALEHTRARVKDYEKALLKFKELSMPEEVDERSAWMSLFKTKG